MGSPMVFHTAPPQPASKARITCSPQLVGGPEASQKGLGQRMPGEVGGEVSHDAPPVVRPSPSAARLPSATASTTSRPPLTQSPPAKYFGLLVRPVARSTTIAPPFISRCSMAVRRDWPRAGITMSQATSNSLSGIGSGMRRPLASGSPRRVRTNLTAAARPFSSTIATGCASQWKRTPSTLE